jgi:formylglycine-generating enzyme required for sulfatase activity
VGRGGSWFNFGWFCRAAHRLHTVPEAQLYHLGFRLARGVPSGGK